MAWGSSSSSSHRNAPSSAGPRVRKGLSVSCSRRWSLMPLTRPRRTSRPKNTVSAPAVSLRNRWSNSGGNPCGGSVMSVTVDQSARRRLDRRAPHLRRGHRHRKRHLRDRDPSRRTLEAKWLPEHRWVAGADGRVAGWAAATPVSARECYAGVAKTSVYVGEDFHGCGVGKLLLHKQVTASDEGGLWTLQTGIFPENRASITLHHAAGFRTVGVSRAHRPAPRLVAGRRHARTPGGIRLGRCRPRLLSRRTTPS